MAKSTTGRARFKIQRALGLELPGLGKAGALERRPYGPGVHGNKRKKISDYAVRLKEKQKLVYHYGLRESQLVTYVKKAKKNKTRAWMDTLIITLESRLNNVLFRLNWAPSVPAASQMIAHGQVLVNGKKVDKSSYLVQVGDVITLSDKGYNNQLYKQSLETPRLPSVPACFTVEGTDKQKATLSAEALPADIPFEYNGQLVTEYYWKVK
ncbi:30S ribosomal protein S4 [Halobacteriovorax sp. GB3]|uniref:30S ribosomal protein S4 n=1 Tax=Halobacteriovorax sp. GB3 TaxID=2719615 RepID=UPI00235FCC24|nr:30S ribosomal protein S4 [Halobacteriovorax sp. GB3]MDD0853567.1 30S ribosomal protein S4 [Halobacteriovorax sp. GB3]